MNTIAFAEQMKAMSNRLVNLCEEANTGDSFSAGFLASALKELGVASERLQIAVEILEQQQRKIQRAEQELLSERQRQQELLEFIPDACLFTDTKGTIQAVNRSATQLLNLPASLLLGRSLLSFFSLEGQDQLQSQLEQVLQRPWKHEWKISLNPYGKAVLRGRVVIEASHHNKTEPFLRWLLRDFSSHSLISSSADSHSHDFNYPLHHYHKGEIIPLEPQTLWQVHSGLVKLTAFANNGQEVLVGLAGQSAPFGASLTTMPLYEATALVDTQLWSISLNDLATSAALRQHVFDQMSQRLKQAELLLVIYGQPRIADRLSCLLELLKEEVGEPVAEGIRLSVRLTHEDLAAACCTTRVTVTRLISQMQQQQKLIVDAHNHLILKAI